MIVRDQFNPLATKTIHDSVESFRLRVTDEAGELIASALPTYQIPGEAMFKPYESAKASGDELQAALQASIDADRERGIDPGIVDEESLRLAMTRLGIGIDCSNFVYRALSALHRELGREYGDYVYYEGSDILQLHAMKPSSWSPRNADGTPRELTADELDMLQSGPVSTAWLADVFGKDLPYIINAHRIADTSAINRRVEPHEAAPGDVIAFTKPGGERVSHVGIVSETRRTRLGDHVLRFYHSWSTRRFADNGLKSDSVVVGFDNGAYEWSDPGLESISRYGGHFFVRPQVFDQEVVD